MLGVVNHFTLTHETRFQNETCKGARTCKMVPNVETVMLNASPSKCLVSAQGVFVDNCPNVKSAGFLAAELASLQLIPATWPLHTLPCQLAVRPAGRQQETSSSVERQSNPTNYPQTTVTGYSRCKPARRAPPRNLGFSKKAKQTRITKTAPQKAGKNAGTVSSKQHLIPKLKNQVPAIRPHALP